MTTLAVGVAIAILSGAIGAYINHMFTRKRDIDAFNRESRERRKQHMAALFSEAHAVGTLLVKQQDAGNEVPQELEDRKCTMLARLQLEAGADIANQWGAYVGASFDTGQSRTIEQGKLEEMMRNHLATICLDLAKNGKD